MTISLMEERKLGLETPKAANCGAFEPYPYIDDVSSQRSEIEVRLSVKDIL